MIRGNSVLFLVNLVFGAYLLNKGLNFLDVSTLITPQIEGVIFVIAGALLALAGFMSMKAQPVLRR